MNLDVFKVEDYDVFGVPTDVYWTVDLNIINIDAVNEKMTVKMNCFLTGKLAVDSLSTTPAIRDEAIADRFTFIEITIPIDMEDIIDTQEYVDEVETFISELTATNPAYNFIKDAYKVELDENGDEVE